jgi:hypothetical protein
MAEETAEKKESRLNRYFDRSLRMTQLGAYTIPRELIIPGPKRDEIVANMKIALGKVQRRAERVFNLLSREDEQTAVAFDIGQLHDHAKKMDENKSYLDLSFAFIALIGMSEGLKVFEEDLGIPET